MTEYEYHDFALTSQLAGGQASMDVVAVFFAYIICVYIVGRKLTSFQVTALTIVYTTFVFMPIIAVHETLQNLQAVAAKYPEYEQTQGYLMAVASVLVPLTLAMAWLLSVVYMLSLRINRNDR